ncbi:MAG: McrB family protein [Candidatus Cryptobacteroides sp.]
MELQHLVALIKELKPNLRCKYVRGEDYCTFLDIEESEPRVNSLTPMGENHSIAGSYLEKLTNGIEPYSPFNISQLMNNSGSNRPIIETIVAHTAEFYWVQIERARYVVWIPGQRHKPGELVEWTDIEKLEVLKSKYTAQLSRQRKTRLLSENNNFMDNYYSRLLLVKHNLILTGAPGTGKTYIAKDIAADIISNGKQNWSSLSDEQKNQVAFVQFHPSYDYTDFVEGLRPVAGGEFKRQDGIFKEFCKRAIYDACGNKQNQKSNNSNQDIDKDKLMSWLEQRDGVEIQSIKSSTKFNLIVRDKKLQVKTSKGSAVRINYKSVIEYIKTGNYDKASHKTYEPAIGQYIIDNCPLFLKPTNNALEGDDGNLPMKPYIFIIDEINRGELSKIFGELFYSIEPDYRGPKGTVQTQYNNMVENDDIFKAGFYVPENVYIIGTMNDVDRGVEAMDFAIRRRFGWKEVTAEESAENMGITGLARVKMDALNKSLLAHNLTKAHCIGGAYFRKLEGDDFIALWNYHLEGIIFEYFRGEPDAQNAIEEIKKDYIDAKLPENTSKKEESVSTEEGSAE